ncbi:hypothetical protein GGX14DRAFT_397035 [Mycena pura]|uniref:Uncharacterized protein n=1 Tax=Mycena pura TaxID=153505 RepID=A0AAD6V9Q2_9AGAR|nr:hypothetical protein GGX14DRAFT_397035 [Mycena pura]
MPSKWAYFICCAFQTGFEPYSSLLTMTIGASNVAIKSLGMCIKSSRSRTFDGYAARTGRNPLRNIVIIYTYERGLKTKMLTLAEQRAQRDTPLEDAFKLLKGASANTGSKDQIWYSGSRGEGGEDAFRQGHKGKKWLIGEALMYTVDTCYLNEVSVKLLLDSRIKV